MANIRTLKLNLLADTTDFAAGIKKASGQTESFSGKLKSGLASVAKSAALAGVAVAGMAVAFGVDAVKAAIADQKSQKQLAVALKNTTKATNAQVKSVENWITKQQFAYGIADDQLRPALAKLTRVTGDVQKAQDLLSLAMDVAAGTGKNLSNVTDALVRAQNGNLAALKKLGVPLDDATIKNKDLAKALDITASKFKGAAAANADTFAGKMAIFNQRVNEAKETIGAAILDAFQPFAEKWLPKISTLVTQIADGFAGKGGKGDGASLGKSIKNVATAMSDFINIISGSTDKTKTMSDAIKSIADAINFLADAIRNIAKVQKYLPNLLTLTRFLQGKGGFGGLLPSWNSTRALGGPVSKGQSYLVGEHGPEIFTPMGGGSITSNSRIGGGGNTFVFNGIVDGESARRSIERVLQQSSIRSGAINLQGSAL